MNLDEFRQQMGSFRKDVNAEAASLKDSYVALDRLHTLYKGFDPEERCLADQVLAEWAVAEDENLRFDALALITDFKVRSAEPALLSLARRLKSSSAPGAPYELKKVDRTLGILAR